MGAGQVICVAPDCDRTDVHCRGLCDMHYSRWRRHRDVTVKLPHRSGSSHPRWKDQIPGYEAAHRRVKKLWGPASRYPCIGDCGAVGFHWCYDGTDPEQNYGPRSRGQGKSFYSAWPEFYMPMCRKCHMGRDAEERVAELEEYREWKHRTRLTLKDIECLLPKSRNEARAVTVTSSRAQSGEYSGRTAYVNSGATISGLPAVS